MKILGWCEQALFLELHHLGEMRKRRRSRTVAVHFRQMTSRREEEWDAKLQTVMSGEECKVLMLGFKVWGHFYQKGMEKKWAKLVFSFILFLDVFFMPKEENFWSFSVNWIWYVNPFFETVWNGSYFRLQFCNTLRSWFRLFKQKKIGCWRKRKLRYSLKNGGWKVNIVFRTLARLNFA